MATYSDSILHGMLLEEAILYILSKSGYSPVLEAGSDASLKDGTSGLEVRGRGAWHQIDAVADFSLVPPFSNPQRLLVEAKFRNVTTGIPVIRNATGVHKDVSENWVVESAPGGGSAVRKRYHYLYAVFSKDPFTKPAQDYAYAQDVYLLPLKRSVYFRPIVDAIGSISIGGVSKPPLKSLRDFVRSKLLGVEADANENGNPIPPFEDENWFSSLSEFFDICRSRGHGFITMFDGKFPVFLSAERSFDELELGAVNSVRIRFSDGNWYIEKQNGRRIFSFDLPEEIFARYEESGSLSRVSLTEIKQEFMSDFYAYRSRAGRIQLIQFRLDRRWFDEVKRNMEQSD